jgi:hypothetical protein
METRRTALGAADASRVTLGKRPSSGASRTRVLNLHQRAILRSAPGHWRRPLAWRGKGLVNVAERNKALVGTRYYAITPQSRFKLLCYRALEEGGLPCDSFLRSCASSPARVLP